MRIELDIPDSTRPELKAHIVALAKRLHDEPEFAADILLDDGAGDGNVQKMFTSERLRHIAMSDAEIDEGKSFTSAQVKEQLRQLHDEWTPANHR